MKNLFRLPLMALSCMFVINAGAQQKCPVNFNKVTPADFDISAANVDTSFGAVILADVGKSSFEGNDKGYFTLIFKVQRRVKILSPKAFDIATEKISLYRSPQTDREEVLDGVSASTYNLVNGKVEETKLNKDNIFKEVLDNKNHVVKKFTMPAVKEGSIIDIAYTIKSDFLFNLQPWSFQGAYPRLWSEYSLNLPEFFEYAFLKKGSQNFHIQENNKKFETYLIRERSENPLNSRDDLFSLSSNNSINRWVMKDVPALKEESFTSSLDNHRSRIEFQMAGTRFPNMPYEDVMGTWGKLCTNLLQDKEFGAAFRENDNWTADVLKNLSLDNKQPLDKAKAIYAYVQKNFNAKTNGGIYLSKPLKETYKTKQGYVQDINMMVTLLLKKAGLDAYPVLISTRANGYATAEYPLIGQYNYVVSWLELDKNTYALDASKPSLGFGKLPSYCYNGYGALVDLMYGSVALFPDTLTESKVTNLILLNDVEKPGRWTGNFISNLGYYESVDIREDIAEKGKSSFEKKLSDAYTGEYPIEKIDLQDFDVNEKSITLKHILNISHPEESIIYFNPMMHEGLKENYFKSAERKYPVELPFKMDETYTLHLQIPPGYVIDEIPKSSRVKLNDSEGLFEYLISKDDDSIELRAVLRINKTFFDSEDYETLRNFFDYVVKKHAEQIVFKKKS
ncbi:MAG: DUF3858 domain-containing protein [Ferruginibacter sp.]